MSHYDVVDHHGHPSILARGTVYRIAATVERIIEPGDTDMAQYNRSESLEVVRLEPLDQAQPTLYGRRETVCTRWADSESYDRIDGHLYHTRDGAINETDDRLIFD